MATTSDRRWFRGDVDGLRALAIVVVVAYHAGVPGFGGGFIGVDVFFVISGYLISRNLLRESETHGRVALGRFWARRVRRLVPALALVVAVTLVAGSFILPAFDLNDFAKQGAAATLYVSNVVFAVQSTDYFAADISTSPFLHTWSLGVEEQFYLVWPVLFAVATWAVVRRSRRRSPGRSPEQRRTLLIAVFMVTFVGSLALNVVLTESGSTWAFFSLPTRAWEFAVAGLVAAVATPRVLRPVGARTAVSVAGLLLLLVALMVIDDSTPYPGLWALLPVTATVLLIVGGETWTGEVAGTPVSRYLSLGPMQWLGRVSYSWYLWHWPAIVLLVVAVDRDTVAVKSAAALATLPVAWLAYRFLETPVRFSPLIARSSARTFVFGAVVTVVVVALAVVIWPDTPSRKREETLTAADFEAPAGSSLEERVAVSVSELRARSDSSCPKHALKTEDGDKYCVGGDPAGTRTLLLLGDSHAGQWRESFDQIARSRSTKLLIRQHSGCPPYPVRITDPKKGAEKTEICQGQQEGDLRVIDALRPDAIVIATWSGNRDNMLDDDDDARPAERDQAAIWEKGVRSLLGDIESRGIPYGVMLDEPTLPMNASDCLAAKDSIEACEVDRATALAISGPLLDVERRVLAEMADVPTIDLTDLVCDAERCRLEIDGSLVYADRHHLTDAFALKQFALLDPFVARLLA